MNEQQRILIVATPNLIISELAAALNRHNYDVYVTTSISDATYFIRDGAVHMVLCDVDNGAAVIRGCHQQSHHSDLVKSLELLPPMLFVTDDLDVEMLVNLINLMLG